MLCYDQRMPISLHDLPIYDSDTKHEQYAWKHGSERFCWDDPSIEMRQARAREKDIEHCINTLIATPCHKWDQLKALSRVLTFLYECSPALIINDQSIPMNLRTRRVVLPTVSNLGVFSQEFQYENKRFFKAFGFLYEHQDSRVMFDLRSSHDIIHLLQSKDNRLAFALSEDVNATLRARHNLVERMEYLYAPGHRMDRDTASDDLFATWSYWMMLEGTPQDLDKARLCSVMMGGTQEEFTLEGFRLAVQQTAFVQQKNLLSTPQLEIPVS